MINRKRFKSSFIAYLLRLQVQRFHLGVDEYHNPAILRLTVGQLFDTIQKEIIHKWNCVHRVNDPSCKAINPLKFKALSSVSFVLLLLIISVFTLRFLSLKSPWNEKSTNAGLLKLKAMASSKRNMIRLIHGNGLRWYKTRPFNSYSHLEERVMLKFRQENVT